MKASADLYEASEAAGRIGAYVWHSAEDSLVWSPGLLRIYGLETAPVHERGFISRVHPEDRLRVEAETSAFLGTDAKTFSHVFRIVRPDGQTRFILDRGVIERDPEGRVVELRGLNVDITDVPPVPARAGLIEVVGNSRSDELEALYAQAPLGLAMLDRKLRFVRINRALADMNGLLPEAHVGKAVWDLLPDLRDSAEPALRRVLETGIALRDVVIRGETPARPGLAREWREHFYPVFESGGAIAGIGIVCEEVTEKAALERANAELQKRLSAALHAGQLGIHEFHPRTGRILWDDRVREIWGVPADEQVTYEVFTAGIHAEDLPDVEARIDSAFDPSGSRHYEAEYRVIHRTTGAVRWVRADGDVTFEGSDAVRLIGTVRDITQRRESEQKLWIGVQKGPC